jgi:hypothetical protein
LHIKPSLIGLDHKNTKAQQFEPFTVGDVAPDGAFIHVLDEVSLNVLLQELDTVADLTAYLERKAELVRSSGRLERAEGEAELLAWYLTSLDTNEERAFAKPDGTDWLPLDRVIAVDGGYSKLTAHPQYIARRKADEISYAWDRLIKIFTQHISDGTIETPAGSLDPEEPPPAVTEMETGVRYMALEPRLSRRQHARALLDAMGKVSEPGLRFFRGLRPLGLHSGTTAFGFLLAAPRNYPLSGPLAYLEYRQRRASMLSAYGMAFLEKHRDLKRFVGIGMEPPRVTQGRGGSEDLVLVEPGEWTSEALSFVAEGKTAFGIFENANPMYPVHDTDFPDVPQANARPKAPAWMNRAQRRKWEAQMRRGLPRGRC